MQYRTLGKTGERVSILGFGCMRLPVIGDNPVRIDEKTASGMIHTAVDAGVNYFDTAYPYHSTNFGQPGASEPFVGKVLREGLRDRVHLATKLPSWLVQSRADMDRLLEEQLKRLQTDRIDFYLVHSLNQGYWDNLLRHDLFDFLEKALASGKIRYAGFSFHDELPLYKRIVDAWDWSFSQIMYNYLDEDFQAGKEGMAYASARNLGTVVMEPLRGGTLVNGLPEAARSLLTRQGSDWGPVEWALHWLWKQPDVHVTLSGMSTPEQLAQNLKLAGEVNGSVWGEEEDRLIARVKQTILEKQRVNCTACGYCLPCPHGVNIPRNFSLCNDFHMLQDLQARGRYHGLLTEEARASNCIQCGECLEKCPQQIDIPTELLHVAELFS
ncbi:MAG: aldo/keto reductase [Bacteroidales bacterium]